MAIITKAGSPSKGSATTFTIDKTELAAHSSVTADAYFSLQANWEKIIVAYTSTEGQQNENLSFDATVGSPTADFEVSSNARDVFEVKALYIYDNQSGYIRIPRSELVTADFDVDMSIPVPVVIASQPTYVGYALTISSPSHRGDQSFSHNTDFSLYEIDLSIDNTGVTGNMVLELRDAPDGGGSLLESSLGTSIDAITSNETVTFLFNGSHSFSSSTTYYIHFNHNGLTSSGPSALFIGASGGDTYPNGNGYVNGSSVVNDYTFEVRAYEE